MDRERTVGRAEAMKLDDAKVREMRRLYIEEGVGSRRLDAMFGHVGSQGIVRGRQWRDPAYVPPAPLRPGPKASLLTIYGETKTIDEWAADPRCDVAARTLRDRVSKGWSGPSLLVRYSNAGRPRK